MSKDSSANVIKALKINDLQKQIAALETQLAESQRREELLRAVGEAARYMFGEASQHEVDGSPYCIIHSDQLLNVYGFMQAAIDGGAMGEGE
jgi:hypothetical protein